MTELDPEQQGDETPTTPEVEAEPFDAGREAGRTYDVPPPGQEGSGAGSSSLALAAACHLLGLADFTVSIFLVGLIAPLVLWLAMKDQDPEVDFAGKESINFQINMLVWWLGAILLSCCLIGLPLLFILPIVKLVLVIMATIQTVNGKRYRYPFIFRVLV